MPKSGNPDPRTNGTNVTNVNYLADYNQTSQPRNDIALLTTNDAPIEAQNVIGLIAFVDPITAAAESLTIKTAGYPGDNVDAGIDGDVEYPLNISPYEPDTRHNIFYLLHLRICA